MRKLCLKISSVLIVKSYSGSNAFEHLFEKQNQCFQKHLDIGLPGNRIVN